MSCLLLFHVLIFVERLFGKAADQHRGAVTSTKAANLIMGPVSPMIDNWAHFGGTLGGAVMAYTFGVRLYVAGLPNGG